MFQNKSKKNDVACNFLQIIYCVYSCGPCRAPGGLEIKAPGDAVHVQHLAAEKEPGNVFTFHTAHVYTAQGHAAGRYKFFFEGGFPVYLVHIGNVCFYIAFELFLRDFRPVFFGINTAFI